METLLIAILLVFIAIFWFKKNKELKAEDSLELDKFEKAYFKRDKLMNQSELSFFLILEKNLSEKYLILTKVRIEDFIGINKNTPHFARYRGYIKSRHVDFLVCDRFNYMKPVLAIELDGSSHGSKRALEIDCRKNKIYEASGLKLKRVKVGENFEQAVSSIVETI